MSQNNKPGVMLRWFLGSVTMCVITLAANAYVVVQHYGTYKSVRNQMVMESGNVFSTLDNTEFLSTSHTTISRLYQEGKLGKVDRLTWIETLGDIAEKLSIDDFHFEMSPAGEQQIGAITVQSVEISIVGNLLHDGLIERFFVMLAGNIESAYCVRQFEAVMQTLPESENRVVESRLEFMADIVWYSVLVPDDQSVMASL